MKNRFLWIALLSLGLVPAGFAAEAENRRERREERREDRRDERREDRNAEQNKPRIRDIDFSDLPREVREEARKQQGEGKIVDVTRVAEGDRQLYRLYFQDDTRSRTLTFNENGKLVNANNTTEEGRTTVKLKDIPEFARNALRDASKGRREIDQIQQVTRYNKTWYVATVEGAGGNDKVVRVGKGGEVLSAADIERMEREHRDNPRLLSDRDDRENRRTTRADRIDEDPTTLKGWEKKTVNFNDLPGEVKQAIGREQRQDKVGQVVRYQKGNQYLYRAEIIGDARSRTVTVSEAGKVVDLDNTTDPGRDSVSYDELPGNVKSTLAKQAGNVDRIRSITQVTRDNRTWYIARIDGPDGDKTVRVGTNGDLINEKDVPNR